MISLTLLRPAYPSTLYYACTHTQPNHKPVHIYSQEPVGAKMILKSQASDKKIFPVYLKKIFLLLL